MRMAYVPNRIRESRDMLCSPIDPDPPRGPSEDGVSNAGESPEDGRLPALRCGGWLGGLFIAAVNEKRKDNPRNASHERGIPNDHKQRLSEECHDGQRADHNGAKT